MEDRTNQPDILEKMFLLGVGAFSLTKEKVEGVVDDLVARGRLTQDEGKDLASEMRSRGEEQRAAVTSFIQ